MFNSGPPTFSSVSRERKSRWDPSPRQGMIEKNFYVIHPDVAQRQEVLIRTRSTLSSGLYLEFREM